MIGNGAVLRLKSLLVRAWNYNTGMTCKKISCYMRDSACRWLIVENAKIS